MPNERTMKTIEAYGFACYKRGVSGKDTAQDGPTRAALLAAIEAEVEAAWREGKL